MIKSIKLEKHHTITLIGWSAKIISILFALVNTRLLLNIIGIEGFALYAILSSLAGWIALFNFGIPNAIQNIIAKYRVDNNVRNELNANIFFVIILLSIISIPPLYGISLIVYKYLLVDYTRLIDMFSIFVILYLFLLLGLSQIFYKILFAEHKGIYPNIYPAIISIVGTCLLLFLMYLQIKNISLILILFFMSYIFIFILSLYQSIGLIKPVFNKKLLLALYNASKHFFIFALLASCTLGFDYIIMSRLLSSIEITQYNLIMKFYNLIIVLYATLLATSWSISAEAFHKKDKSTIVSLVKKNIIIGSLLTILISAIVILFKNDLFLLLSGKELNILYSTLFLATVYTLIRIWTDTFASILSSINEVKLMIFILPVQATISLVGQYFFAKYLYLNGIFLGLIISFIFTVAIILPVFLNIKLKDLNEKN